MRLSDTATQLIANADGGPAVRSPPETGPLAGRSTEPLAGRSTEPLAGRSQKPLAGRFQVVRTLKAGEDAETLLARDLHSGDTVVVKTTVPGGTAAARRRLEQEARALAEIHRSHISPAVETGEADGRFYVSRQYVHGISLAERLDDRGRLEPLETLAVGRDLLGALQRAHDEGVLHRDIKPANVIVGPAGAVRNATLIDFGLACPTRHDPGAPADNVAGARYVSPEQAGVLEHQVGPPSDLYSLGVLLFECLAGRPPFQGGSVGELLRRHLTEPAPDLRQLGVHVPRVLDELVLRLLRKDPADRYQSAGAVLADLEEIERAVASGINEPSLVIGMRDPRRQITEPAFVGRRIELEALDARLQAAAGGEGGLVVVEAVSGGGKSRLLYELAQRSATFGASVLRGQGTQRAASRPYQMLGGVAQDVARSASAGEPLAALRERLAPQREAIGAALPELTRVLGAPSGAGLGPEDFAEARTLDALVALIDALGSPGHPALILLDDCQWADGMTVKLIGAWERHRAEARVPCHVLLVAAYRSEEVARGHGLRGLAPALRLTLAPFGSNELGALLESMAGELPDAAARLVGTLSEGNPFMASAVLRGLVESGALVGDERGWRVEPIAMADVQSSRQAAAFLVRRLELLPEAALKLLSVGAMLGKEFELSLAAQLAGQSSALAAGALAEARRRHIVWASEEQADRCAFVHDKLRDALLGRLGEQPLRRLQAQAALTIEQLDSTRVFELAYHFSAAGQDERALPYAMRAAEQARARQDLEVADTQYRIAERGAVHAPRALMREIAEGLGETLMLRGRYDLAEERLRVAQRLADGSLEQVRIAGKLAELSFKRGDMARASEAIEQGLRELGQRVPSSPFAYLRGALREVFFQALHTLAPRVFPGHRAPDAKGRALLAARLYSRLAHCYWFQRGRVPTLWAHLRGLNLAETQPPGLELAQAYSEHSPVMTMLPWFSRGIRYARRSLEIRTRLGDSWGQGQSLHFYGVGLYGASRFEDCIERCREAVRLLERAGDRWEINTANWHIAFSLYRLGRLSEAAELAEAIWRAGQEIGDAQASGISLGVWAKASGGRVPPGLVEEQLERPSEDVHTRAEVLMASALQAMAAGDPARGAEALEQAQKLVEARGLRQEYVAPVLPWLATALRMQHEHVPALAAGRRRELERRRARTTRRALRLARSYRNNLPHALRERALYQVARGRPRRARRLLARSLELAERQGAACEAAQTILWRGRIGRELGWPAAQEDLVNGEIELRRLQASPYGEPPPLVPGEESPSAPGEEVVTLSLADRFDQLLESGCDIARELSREGIFAAVQRAAQRLLRGERSLLVSVAELGDELTVTGVIGPSGAASEALWREMALAAARDERPVSFSAASRRGEESSSQALDISGVRSALCVPISVRGAVQECLYIDHRQVDELFGEEERRLAEFIATLAGAALENAEGFGEVEALTRTLERRVEERTAQLEAREGQLDSSLQQLTEAFDRERETARQLKHQAFHDSLTDLANRALFVDRVEHALERAQRQHAQLAVLFMDLDDFKTINDSLGHPVGDELLVAVAERLRQSLRRADTASRLGGDEFAVLIEDIHEASAAIAAAERIIESFETPFSLGGKEVFVHASVGIAMRGDGDVQGDELLRNADVAMYTSKSRGKRRYELFEQSMHDEAVHRLELKADLQRALEHSELVVEYQPIVDLASSRIVGTEALVRWRHPERGLVAPTEFVGLAEETGLIVSIGAFVLRTACRQARLWQLSSPACREMVVSVNLSARELQEEGGVLARVAEALEDSGLRPQDLILEITEGALMKDMELIVERLHGLKSLGVQIAIDDFGTGYSSLGYLKRFPVDILKIAKPFVDDLAGGDEDEALAGAVVQMSATLNLRTIAEGVETEAQLQSLRRLGCDLGQGYLFSRPVPESSIDELLAKGTALQAV